MRLFGFSLLRNAVKYDYCFTESLSGLAAVVEKTFLALGDNEDNTEEMLDSIPNIVKIHTVWDEKLRDSGLILSQQTNIALEAARSEQQSSDNSWGVYLQADEVLHENDYKLIADDIKFANENGYDSVAFRYKHFWHNHNQLTVGKKWYPVEVRAIKLNSNIKSIRDAQGFECCTKIYQSNAFIYHYGHVREERIYRLKKADFHKLYNTDENLLKAEQKEERKYKQGRFLKYFGTHPAVMKDRINRFNDTFRLPQKEEIWILADKNLFAGEFVKNILATKINWITKVGQCPANMRKTHLVIFMPDWFENLWYPSSVKKRPDSDLGTDWTNEYVLTLKLSEKLIGVL